MTSSSSFELRVLQDGAPAARLPFVLQPLETRSAFSGIVETSAHLILVASAFPREGVLRVRMGDATVLTLPPSEDSASAPLSHLVRDLCGEAILTVELVAEDELDHSATLVTATLPLRAPPETERLYEVIVRDLEQAHLGMARDLLGRGSFGATSSEPRVFDPERDVRRLRAYLTRMQRALQRIALQPATALAREVVRSRYRPGDLLDTRAVDRLLRDPDLEMVHGRPRRVGRMIVRRTRRTTDLPEHRHLAAALRSLKRRAHGLADSCRRSASLLAEEERRWGLGSRSGKSVFEERHLPRIERFRELAATGESLGSGFHQLLGEHDFLAEARKPRRRFGPTPLFLGSRTYRDAFEIIREARRDLGPVMDAEEIRFRLRNLDTLFEYWVFVSTVNACRELFGPPREGSGFRVVHETYRPDLTPGQSFTWRLSGDQRIQVFYEPGIAPDKETGRGRWAREAGAMPLRASLVGAPLRPDVLILHEVPGRPLRGVVLDAKNTTRFDRTDLFRVSDYRTLVHEPRTGRQPIRALFLVHRTREARLCSLPGFFRGREVPRTASLLGAFPHLPDEPSVLGETLERLLRDRLVP